MTRFTLDSMQFFAVKMDSKCVEDADGNGQQRGGETAAATTMATSTATTAAATVATNK